MPRRLLLPMACLLLLVLGIGACAVIRWGRPADRGNFPPATIKIGLQAPLTGIYADEGQTFKNTLDMLIQQANDAGGFEGRSFELIVEDDKGEAVDAEQAAYNLIAHGVVAVIGSYGSGATDSVMDIYNAAGVLQISPTAAATRLTWKGNDKFFRLTYSGERQASFTAQFAKQVLDARNVAILYDVSTDSRDLAEWTERYMQSQDINVGVLDSFYPQETDFSPTLAQIEMARIDTIYFTGSYPQGSLLLKQAKDLGLKQKWLLGSANADPQLVQTAGVNSAKGAIVISQPLPFDLQSDETKNFSESFSAAYGQYPQNTLPLLAGDSFNIIQYAMQQTSSTDPTTLAAYLHQYFENVPGLTGQITGFYEQGDRSDPVFRAYVVNDKGEFEANPKQPK